MESVGRKEASEGGWFYPMGKCVCVCDATSGVRLSEGAFLFACPPHYLSAITEGGEGAPDNRAHEDETKVNFKGKLPGKSMCVSNRPAAAVRSPPPRSPPDRA